jgi:tRNA pseudouridine38-40 synthase
MRIALGVEYDGTGFAGWEQQPGARTVQGVVTEALGKVADHPVHVLCAGRTDAGVHAWGQVVHMEAHAVREMRAWVLGGNANLPGDVSLLWARPVAGDFHARFSARSRYYRYVVYNSAVRPAILATRVAWECRPLDVERMQSGAGYLLGEHDFSSYRAMACQARSPVRRVHRLSVTRQGSMVFMDVVADAFLHHMVRNIAGVLMAIGMGKRPTDWSETVLKARDRTRGGVTAPPLGLYLMRVDYPERHQLPRLLPPPLVW